MTKEEVNNILDNMTYLEYVNMLNKKYGEVPKDYFYTNKNGILTKNPGITRGKDGLYIHHVYECYFLGLSDPTMYILQLDLLNSKPNEDQKFKICNAQKAENLVYCNLLEHLILHIKITLEYKRGQEHVGIDFITGDLNRLYELGDDNMIEQTYSAKQHLWKRQVYYNIQNDYNIYVFLAKLCVNKLKLPIDLICNVTFYNTQYKKLADDITK